MARCVAKGRGGGEGVHADFDGQGLDDDDARAIAENLSKFKRLRVMNLVSWG